MLGIESNASYMQSKRYTNWAIVPADSWPRKAEVGLSEVSDYEAVVKREVCPRLDSRAFLVRGNSLLTTAQRYTQLYSQVQLI